MLGGHPPRGRDRVQAGKSGPPPLQVLPEDRPDAVGRVVWSLHRQPVRRHEPHAVHANLLDLASSLLLPDDPSMRSQVPEELQPCELGILDDGMEDRPQIVLSGLDEPGDPLRLPQGRPVGILQAVVMRSRAGELRGALIRCHAASL